MLASPTPAPSGPTRRSSQRQALRSASRSQPSRSAGQPVYASGGAGPGPEKMSNSSKQYNDESSEDEIPVPMKLSALTKALLDDGVADAPPRAASPPRTRRQASVLNSSTNSDRATDARRTLRSRSVQHHDASVLDKDVPAEKSREPSPVRKRVVRLSNGPQSISSLGGLGPTKRTSLSTAANSRRSSQQPPSRPSSRADSHPDEKPDANRDLNTPSQGPLRVVRISTNSSAKRRLTSRRSSGLNMDASMADGSAVDLPAQNPARREEADPMVGTIGSASKSANSRYPSSSLRGARVEDNGVHGSMRIKRVGKTPGGFFSGPARRGKRRQSDEEEGDEPLDAERFENQDDRPLQSVEDQAPMASIRDFNSGSPVSSNAAVRAIHRRQASNADLRMGSRQPSPRESQKPEEPKVSSSFEAGFPSPKGIQLPPKSDEPAPSWRPSARPEMPSNHDQENEMPASWRRSRASADRIIEKIPSRPLHSDHPPVRSTPAERPALADIAQNTPVQPVPAPPPKMSVLETATSNAGAATTTQAKQRRNVLRVNGKIYTRLDCIGRGGSAKVYRVTAENGHMFALKRVSLENTDEVVLRGFRGEIELLTKLNGVERVIKLFDHEMNSEKKVLYLVMEMGELDMGSIIKARVALDETKFDPVFVRYYWKEMLECLQSVHQHAIVHSDLKPANFVLVRGRLKLIDFGIANAIADHTRNVHRDTQIGTPSYMSPESLLDSNSAPNGSGARIAGLPKLMKLGRPSDVWSLGCILYQMVYGASPFAHIANQMSRCQAIINPNHQIEFPVHAPCGTRVPNSILKTMKGCLNRNPGDRPSVDALLKGTDSFLYPRELPDDSLPVDREMLGRIVQDAVRKYVDGQEHPDPRKRPHREELRRGFSDDYWNSLRKAAVAKGSMW